MNKKLIAAVIGFAALAASTAASAHVDLAIGVGIPAPVYVEPQPVYVAPPVAYAPAPVAVDYWHRDDWREREWRRHEWREHEWRDHEWRGRRGWGD